jgi:hypothetical protein
MKKFLKLLPLALLLAITNVSAKSKVILLDDNSEILGKWTVFAETAALHKIDNKKLKNKWIFHKDGTLSSFGFDTRLNGFVEVKVNYEIVYGFIIKQVQPSSPKTETCKVVKLKDDLMTLKCKYLYYLLKR